MLSIYVHICAHIDPQVVEDRSSDRQTDGCIVVSFCIFDVFCGMRVVCGVSAKCLECMGQRWRGGCGGAVVWGTGRVGVGEKDWLQVNEKYDIMGLALV